MGGGRSGTTLLDIMIGNADNVYSCGELVRVPELHGVPHGCTVGMPAYDFWDKIIRDTKYIQEHEYSSIEKLVSKMDFHRAFPYNYFGLLKSENIKLYSEYVDDLYCSIFKHIDEDVIVDSSKYPSRALALSKFCSYDIKFIYLIRHPADVIKAFQKKGLEQPPKSILSANIYYFLVNMACHMVLNKFKKDKYSIVQYNALVSDPVSTLGKIQDDLGIDLGKTIEKIQHEEELDVAHLFEGNRIRMKDSIKLQSKDYARKYSLFELPTIILNWVWWSKSRR